MQILYLSRRKIMKSIIIISVLTVSLIYSKHLRMGTLSVLFNNEGILPIYSVDLPDKKVALTFDIAWGNQYNSEILDTLKRYDIKSTFFITGSWAEKYPSVVKRIASDGHEIGNHSLNHPKMSTLSKDEMASEIKGCETNIMKLTGKKTKLFRCPYGDYNNTLITLAHDMGYKVIQWDVDSLDWDGASGDDIYNRTLLKAGSGSIILFHNNSPSTLKALERIIEELRNKGYRFMTVSELLIKDDYYIDSTGSQHLIE